MKELINTSIGKSCVWIRQTYSGKFQVYSQIWHEKEYSEKVEFYETFTDAFLIYNQEVAFAIAIFAKEENLLKKAEVSAY